MNAVLRVLLNLFPAILKRWFGGESGWKDVTTDVPERSEPNVKQMILVDSKAAGVPVIGKMRAVGFAADLNDGLSEEEVDHTVQDVRDAARDFAQTEFKPTT